MKEKQFTNVSKLLSRALYYVETGNNRYTYAIRLILKKIDESVKKEVEIKESDNELLTFLCKGDILE
jgi:CRISPR/Cas system-associated protein Cas7 (RAMP superfamily)